ncbi:MAG TPA: glycosyltransferase [Caulobacteraceae bacterium]|nr:glycosyltransferase [Caulobacteraceae bacterium]
MGSADPAFGGPLESILRQNDVAEYSIRELLTLDAPDAGFIADLPLRTHAIGATPRVASGPVSSILSRYRFTPALHRWLLAHGREYDVIIVNGLWNYAAMGASLVLPGLGVPYFVVSHGMMSAYFKKNYPLKHAAKQISWLFGEGRLLHHARSVLFATETERTLARRQYWGWSYNEEVVGSGTVEPPPADPTALAALRAQIRLSDGQAYLLFMGRLHRVKGCDLLLQAFAQSAGMDPNVVLVMAGPDESGWRGELEALAQALQISERIRWTGMLSGQFKWAALRGAAALVLPSHQENFGMVVAEALACATPVLISDKVNIWREIEQDGAGLVAPDTKEGIASLLERFLTSSVAEKEQMRAAARRCFLDRFDLRRVGRRLQEVLAACCR